ncbi:MAG TPA: MerR family transcriptional regulator [Gemmatimonadales bacterium]
MPSALFTLRSIARELGLPESTVRYYRDAFNGFLPVTGRGRRRRYPAEAIGLLALIAEGFAENRSREEIEEALLDNGVQPPDSGSPVAIPAVFPRHRAHDGPAHEMLALVLDGERERREAMWQMAREIVRLGEAIERQHTVLFELARHLDLGGAPALPPPSSAMEIPAPPDRPEAASSDELATLRHELEREREIVERLRRSKLDLERRAAAAETALEDSATRGGGLFRRRSKPSDEP